MRLFILGALSFFVVIFLAMITAQAIKIEKSLTLLNTFVENWVTRLYKNL